MTPEQLSCLYAWGIDPEDVRHITDRLEAMDIPEAKS